MTTHRTPTRPLGDPGATAGRTLPGARATATALLRPRRARAAAVSLAAAIALALAAVLTAGATPAAFQRDESLSLRLDALPDGTGSAHRVVRIPTTARVTDVVVTTSGHDDLAWSITLCPQDGECLPVSSALVGRVLHESRYDLRVDVDDSTDAAGAPARLDGHIALLQEPLPAHDLARVVALGLGALAAALVGAVLLRPTELRPARQAAPRPASHAAPHPVPHPDTRRSPDA